MTNEDLDRLEALHKAAKQSGKPINLSFVGAEHRAFAISVFEHVDDLIAGCRELERLRAELMAVGDERDRLRALLNTIARAALKGATDDQR